MLPVADWLEQCYVAWSETFRLQSWGLDFFPAHTQNGELVDREETFTFN